MKIPDQKRATPPGQATSDDALRQFIGYNMKRVYLLVRADMARVLAPLGLGIRTFSALAVILENPDITQSQLASALSIDRSGVVVLVDELESADLIARNRVEGDRRSYALRATLRGQRLWAQAEAAVTTHENELFAALSPAERISLGDMLRRVVDANPET